MSRGWLENGFDANGTWVLITAHSLFDRLRYPRSKAEDLLRLRCRLMTEAAPEHGGNEERQAGLALRRLRIALVASLDGVQACATCAMRHPLPNGRWDGGHCCGGSTENVFTEIEIASLRIAGTRPSHFRAPSSDQAGCVFRGPTGCSLPPEHRPNICVRYLCRKLRQELRERDDIERVLPLCEEIYRTFTQFARLRAERLQDEYFAEFQGLRQK